VGGEQPLPKNISSWGLAAEGRKEEHAKGEGKYFREKFHA